MQALCLLGVTVALLMLHEVSSNPLRVCIYNDANFHGEVWPAFAYEFMQLGHSVSVFSNEGSFRMGEAVASWLTTKASDY
jgi:hypothetical protein